MCGISAAIVLENKRHNACKSQAYRNEVTNQVDRSLERIKHRGPDSRGSWISEDNRIALGHVRLSIKDLTDAATQPLSNAEGDIHIVVNGEFYGYQQLYEELSDEHSGSYKFRTASDSELLIALYERDGVNCLSYLRGEFAFILYDSKRQLLFAARDRFGVKPLFWTIADDRLLIASEAKAFIPYGWQPEWDTRSVVEDGWLHDERTLFKGVRKVMPGHYMTCLSFEYLTQRPYWEIEYADKTKKDSRTFEEMTLELRKHLYESVELRVQGDVPIGVYLSGGLDSSIIAGILADILQKRKKRSNGTASDKNGAGTPLACFCVGFEEGTDFDEMPIAQRTADHLGAPLYARRLDEQTFAEEFEATTISFEHHNPDLNSIAKYVLSKLTADHGVKVVLSGEGSDEHFGGYTQFEADAFREPDLTWGTDELSSSQREELTRMIESRTTPGFKGVPKRNTNSESQLARRMLNNSFISAGLWVVTVAPFAAWTKSFGELSVQETRAMNPDARSLDLINSIWHPLHTAQYIWCRSILTNWILTSMGDRMEMAHSVEGRPAFLDHHLTQFANHLPPSAKVKINHDTGYVTEKWILREAGKPYITQEMYERKKHPFSAPYRFDVGGPMHTLLCRLLTRENIERLGFVDIDITAGLIDRAFCSRDDGAMRAAIVVAQWVALANEFNIPRAGPGDSNGHRTDDFIRSSLDQVIEGVQSLGQAASSTISQASSIFGDVRVMY